ncbi:hypothetical protein BC939DRAFT_449026 [Gamsiella multidivaricata]|uniref:uncharacterized protein n=1 Tax=Gamsiella multidivaricata TaxID=101098 RepID=UPI00221F610F|nr:uncharacterized protein BC939DRAFT_449026 [Gamsiella multidivaricata]KAI7825212.1 hypothetical protein BC939DRAFT_449026 [Gamsiella multidivaricata]
MLSLSQLILPSSAKIAAGAQPAGPPHYNILVLGSDSAPLASTLYKMSSLLPSTNKISHYQEISGFFVAYFRSNGSFSCSPKTSTELSEKERRRRSGASFRAEGDEEVKARGKGLEEIDQEGGGSRRHSTIRRSSAESEATLLNAARGGHSRDGTTDSDEDDKATLYQESLSTTATAAVHEDVPLSASANATLSVHAFSLDTTWPVPRILAQTFWFPHAHGIIYIVDATRKNDPRGMDHLLNARQFLASLVKDEHFRRKDIPVVVFANKAGMDEETCFRVDEIAEILGCEEWDDEGRVTVQGGKDMETAGATGDAQKVRAWCVKSTRSDGEGEGLRESVEWLKSRMGEIWKS